MYSTALSTGWRLVCAAVTERLLSGRTAVNGVRILIGDLNAELLHAGASVSKTLRSNQGGGRNAGGSSPYLLNGHHDLHGVQAVQAKVVCEVCRRLDLYNLSIIVLHNRIAYWY